jgi:hypothetical protein
MLLATLFRKNKVAVEPVFIMETIEYSTAYLEI